MTSATKAIETRYAGCRFRSRLEARWAVFFDTLGIAWEYEPQGYVIDGEPYLPDFWLPNPGMWVEVKGRLDHADLRTLIAAASITGLPLRPDEPIDHTNRDEIWWTRPRILLLGQVPEPGRAWLHTRIDVLFDQVVIVRAQLLPGKVRSGPDSSSRSLLSLQLDTARPAAWYPDAADDALLRRLKDGSRTPILMPVPPVNKAYDAARSARFEYGETPTSHPLPPS